MDHRRAADAGRFADIDDRLEVGCERRVGLVFRLVHGGIGGRVDDQGWPQAARQADHQLLILDVDLAADVDRLDVPWPRRIQQLARNLATFAENEDRAAHDATTPDTLRANPMADRKSTRLNS